MTKPSKTEVVTIVLAVLTVLQIVAGFSRWLSPEESADVAQMATIAQRLADVADSVNKIEAALPAHMVDYATFKATTQGTNMRHEAELGTLRMRQQEIEVWFRDASR